MQSESLFDTRVQATPTSTTKCVHHLVSLLLVIEIPSLFKCPYRLRRYVGSLVLSAKVETVEDKNTCYARVLEELQLSFDIIPQGERESAKSDQEWLTGGRVEEVLFDVMRRINTDDGTFESGEWKGLRAGSGPFIQWADY